MKERSQLTVMVIPDGGDKARTMRVSYSRLRWIAAFVVLAFLILTFLIGSWWFLLVRARQADLFEEQILAFREQEAQIESFVRSMEEMEEAYNHLRSLFGPDRSVNEVWLPSPGRSTAVRAGLQGEEGIPSSWPLPERGFVTQSLLDLPGLDHPGIDIAIPAGTYIRAAGDGVVVEVGEDPIYGRYLVLEHGRGYRSLYAHASHLFVTEGIAVRRHEVLALSGSSGRSTAPHLHFEILRDGEAIDPLTMVAEP